MDLKETQSTAIEPDIEARGLPLRIRYADQAEGASAPPALNRRFSVDSLSIHSIGRRRSVDPGVALPIEFRTLCVPLINLQHAFI